MLVFALRLVTSVTPIAQQIIAAVQPRTIPAITPWLSSDREVEAVELEGFG